LSGFGTSPFGSGPFGLPGVETSESQRSTLVSSRFIDANGRAEQLSDGSGDFRAMNDTMQRALFSLAPLGRNSDRIGADFAGSIESEVRTLLAPLLNEGVLEIVNLAAEDSGRSTTSIVVTLRDRVDGRTHTVTV